MNHPPDADTVLIRHGEIHFKSDAVRSRMTDRLLDNVRALLADRDIPAEVTYRWTRPLIVTDPAHIRDATRAATDAFGVVSASPTVTTDPALDAILDALSTTAAAEYTGGSFAIDARRADKSLPFTSQDVAIQGGDAVADAVDFEPSVDLDNPDMTFSVEVRNETAFIFTETVRGPGGLPLGTQGPVVSLISGGIDSPVATYLMMKRGCPVIPIYLDLGPFGGPDHRERAVDTVKTLAAYAPNFDMDLHIVPGGETLSLLAETFEKGRMVAFRRYLYRVAEVIATKHDAHGIVTGEALGQKSSQTAENLAVATEAATLPVYRPLLSWDKNDITEQAKRIGTFSASTIPAGCNRFAPDTPATRAHLDTIQRDEPDDLFDRAEQDAGNAERIPIHDLC